jgi:hypothetical protein
VIACLAVAVGVYAGSYLCLRAAHQIRCFSNARNWHPEKRSPEHNMSARKPLAAVFAPLMFAESSIRTAAARLAG